MPQSAPEHPAAPLVDPVARVLVDVGLPHLDRPFDYRVRPDQAHAAVAGARVRVRFAGRLTSGYILERASTTDHVGDLADLERVVSAEPVLTPEVAELARRVADHYAGTRADVLRLAIPPRHARTEQAGLRQRRAVVAGAPSPGEWERYPAGGALLDSLAQGGRPRAVLSVLPGSGWPELLARAAAATLAGGRGAVLVVPDTRDVARLDAALTEVLGPDQHVALHAEQGPSARYRRFLAVLRGETSVVVGTRSAVFAPVRDLGLLAVWDDGDDLLAEPRAPYPHARDVALIRAHQHGCAVLLAGHARTAEAARLVQTGWARDVRADRPASRAAAARVLVTGGAPRAGARRSRVPDDVFRVVRTALAHGPVLVHVPRRGYRPTLACQRCRTAARCPRCAGPLGQARAGEPPQCHWCRHPVVDWVCAACGDTRLRAPVVGEQRTAEELGRAFPGTVVRQSGLGHVLDDIPATPSLVVCTPGAEPVAAGGYAAAVLLDVDASLARADLRAAEECLRRWLNVVSLVRPAGEGGVVLAVGDPAHRAVQALVRLDPAGFAERELADREAAHLPPAWRIAELTGPSGAVDELLDLAAIPPEADVLGPVPVDEDDVRVLVRAPLDDSPALTHGLRAAAGVRSARRRGGAVRIRVDPVDVG